ncbi:MAG: hypothetical protein ABSG15_03535 [FCB group bacterium]|jgi:hypothetical protein
MIKKKSSICHANIITVLLISFLSVFFSNNSYTQSKSKENANLITQNTNTDCKPLEKLKTALETLKKSLTVINEKSKKNVPVNIKKCETELINFKKECPQIDATPFEEELAKYKKQWDKAAFQSKGKVAAGELILKAYWQIQPIAAIRDIKKGTYEKKADALEFNSKARRINYINLRKEIEDLLSAYPTLLDNAGFKKNYDEVMIDFPISFRLFVKDYLMEEIRNNIEKAYDYNLTNEYADAIESTEASIVLCNSVLLIDTTNKDVKEIKEDAETLLNNLGGEHGKVVYTSIFHRDNPSKIFFSHNTIIIKKENPKNFTNSFIAGDSIFGMIYLKSTFENLIKEPFTCILSLEAEGKEITNYFFQVPPDKRTSSYFPLEVVVDLNSAKSNYVPKFVKALSDLFPSKHIIKVLLKSDSILLGSGEFELDCSQGTDKLKEMAEVLSKKVAFKNEMPKSLRDDPWMQQDMLTTVSDWKDKPINISILEPDWNAEQTITGQIIYRYISTCIAVKTPEGDCKLVYVKFKQDFDGYNFGKTQVYKIEDTKDISCEKIIK